MGVESRPLSETQHRNTRVPTSTVFSDNVFNNRLNHRMKVPVEMVVYNEQATLPAIVEAVFASPFEIELLCGDDGSTDGSREILWQSQSTHAGMRVLLQTRNMCTGAALHRFMGEATGDGVVIRDRDLEYDLGKYATLLGRNRSSEAKRMCFLGRALWEARPTGCSTSGTR